RIGYSIELPRYDDFHRHQVTHRDGVSVQTLGHQADHDIAIGDDAAGHLAPIDLIYHDYVAYVVFTHQAGSFAHCRVSSRDHDLAGANVSDRHSLLLLSLYAPQAIADDRDA